MKVFHGFVLFLVLVGMPLASVAGEAPAPTPQQLSEIVAQQRQLRSDLQSGAVEYQYVDARRKRHILEQQDHIFALLDNHASLDELNTDDQLRVFNSLKQIESYLGKRNEDDHMICERVAIAGTRRYQMACMTKEERDRRAEGAIKTLMNRQACTTAGCTGE